jgi:hypothetical protein
VPEGLLLILRGTCEIVRPGAAAAAASGDGARSPRAPPPRPAGSASGAAAEEFLDRLSASGGSEDEGQEEEDEGEEEGSEEEWWELPSQRGGGHGSGRGGGGGARPRSAPPGPAAGAGGGPKAAVGRVLMGLLRPGHSKAAGSGGAGPERTPPWRQRSLPHSLRAAGGAAGAAGAADACHSGAEPHRRMIGLPRALGRIAAAARGPTPPAPSAIIGGGGVLGQRPGSASSAGSGAGPRPRRATSADMGSPSPAVSRAWRLFACGRSGWRARARAAGRQSRQRSQRASGVQPAPPCNASFARPPARGGPAGTAVGRARGARARRRWTRGVADAVLFRLCGSLRRRRQRRGARYGRLRRRRRRRRRPQRPFLFCARPLRRRRRRRRARLGGGGRRARAPQLRQRGAARLRRRRRRRRCGRRARGGARGAAHAEHARAHAGPGGGCKRPRADGEAGVARPGHAAVRRPRRAPRQRLQCGPPLGWRRSRQPRASAAEAGRDPGAPPLSRPCPTAGAPRRPHPFTPGARARW